MRKRDVSRPFPPEFVDVETLAYLLSVSESTITSWRKSGKLPGPIEGLLSHGLVRWHWPAVREHLLSRDKESDDEDPIMTAIRRHS
jgi:hypothetical protein